MPFNPSPRFRTKHWRALYESYILEFSTLRDLTAEKLCVFVNIDSEPWGGNHTKPAQIGLSLSTLNIEGTVLESASLSKLDKITTLEAAAPLLETHQIRIMERQKQNDRRREKNRFGKEHLIEDAQVEPLLSSIIRQFLSCHNIPQDTPLILAGFHLTFEFFILSSLYPGILRCFTHWLDVQQVAMSLSSKTFRPGLGETLVAFGSEPRNAQCLSSQHDSATDTVRIAALIIRFLGDEGHAEISFRRPANRSHRGGAHRSIQASTAVEKKFWCSRPKPKEFYPYTASLYHTTGFEITSPEDLHNFFSDYKDNLVAVGIQSNKRCAYICLRSLEELNDFVRQIDGSTLNDGDIWRAVSLYDPSIIPMSTAAEYLAQKGWKRR